MTDAGQRALASAIEKLRERIGQMRHSCPSVGEQNTKAALVNPLLAAIGWDLENIDEVSLEYRSHPRDNPVAVKFPLPSNVNRLIQFCA